MPYIAMCFARRNAFGLMLGGRAGVAFGRRLRLVPLRAAGVAACIGLLGGCSVSMPMASLMPGSHDEETGMIAKLPLAGWLDGEDWKHAKQAFSRALDAEKIGSAMSWDNPNSGAKGTFVALGRAYPGEAGLCRAFHADIDRRSADDVLEGTACAGKSGEWKVTAIKPTKKG